MKLSTVAIGLLAACTPLVAAWTKEDREIFRVRDELAAILGSDVTFYDFVGVSPGASIDDINKAYRKKTRSLHPDKVKQQLAAERARAAGGKKDSSGSGGSGGSGGGGGKKKPGVHVAKPPTASEVRAAVKRASDMQARLSIVANILRGPGRDRYDHFLAHGFPVWKGTEYYYNRYRPGIGTVLFGLFVFVGGGAHYLALYMSWKRQREFVERYIRYARHAAWGSQLGAGVAADVGSAGALPPNAVPDPGLDDAGAGAMAMNRKQRRMQERETKREAARENSGGRRGRRAPGGGGAGGAGGSSSGTATPTAAAPAGPTGAKKRVVAENGKVLVVDSLGDVYLEQVDEEGKVEELLLDINEVACPTFRDTAVYRLPAWVYQLTIGRVLPKATPGGSEAEGPAADREATPRVRRPQAAAADTSDDDNNGDSSPGKATPSTDSNDDFELLEKSTGSLKATGSSHNKAKASKRKGKKK